MNKLKYLFPRIFFSFNFTIFILFILSNILAFFKLSSFFLFPEIKDLFKLNILFLLFWKSFLKEEKKDFLSFFIILLASFISLFRSINFYYLYGLIFFIQLFFIFKLLLLMLLSLTSWKIRKEHRKWLKEKKIVMLWLNIKKIFSRRVMEAFFTSLFLFLSFFNLFPISISERMENILLFTLLIGGGIVIFVNRKKITEGVSCVKKDQEKKKIYDFIVLTAIFSFGIILRGYRLGYLPPIRDEYKHLIAAKRLVKGGKFNYPRALPITYLVALMFKIFNIKIFDQFSLAVARIVPLFFGSLTTLLVYFLGKKINKAIGVISAFLWATSPFSIGISRFIREYSLYCFIILLVYLYFIHLLNKVNKIRLDIKNIFKIIIFIIPFLYVFVDWSGTYVSIFMIIPIPLLLYFFIALRDFKAKKRKAKSEVIKLGIVLVVFLTVLGLLVVNRGFGLIKKKPSFQQKYFNLFFNPNLGNTYWSASQWFFGTPLTKFFLVGLFLISVIVFIRNKYWASYFFSFAIYFFALLYFFERYFAAKYAYYIFPFYVLIYATSIYLLFSLAKKLVKSCLLKITIIIFLLSIFNPLTSVRLLLEEEVGRYDKKIRVRHANVFETMEILNNNGFHGEKDLVITTLPEAFGYFYNREFIEEAQRWPLMIFVYQDKNKTKFLYDYPKNVYPYEVREKGKYLVRGYKTVIDIINNNDEGWVVIRTPKWRKFLNETEKELKFIGQARGRKAINIYRWGK